MVDDRGCPDGPPGAMLTCMTLEVISRPAAQRRHSQPLLFVHGAWHGAWCWDEHVLGHVAGLGWDAHAVSLRGHGGSSGGDRLRWHRIKDYVVDVGQVVADLGPDTVLVGHSMGGLVVQKYLELYPAPAAALLASVPPRGVLPLTLRVARRHPALFARANATMSLAPLVSTSDLVREPFFSPDMPDDLVRDFTRGSVTSPIWATSTCSVLRFRAPAGSARRSSW